MKGVVRKSGFNLKYRSVKLGEWVPHDQQYSAPKHSYKKLADRHWQQQCFHRVKDKRLWIINAPMAAGKSLLICAVAHAKMVSNPKLRVIISVPQTVIADGFVSEQLVLACGTSLHWSVSARNDLCSDKRDPIANSTIQHALHWLKRPAGSELEDRVLLCAHATLVETYSADPGTFQDVLVVIDEAHHAVCTDTEGLRLQNRLGALVRHALDTQMEMGLTTATFFRSDTETIVPKSEISKFARYNLSVPEFLEAIRPFKRFSYDFLLYEISWLEPLCRMFQERLGKTIVYVPNVLSSASLGGKHCDTDLIIQAIAGCANPEVRDADKPVMLVKRKSQWVRVINLVDERGRGAKKEAIFEAQRSGNADGIDVIIALNMFREGANWEWADRAIIIGPRNSLVDLLQTLGRLFRRPKSGAKPHARVIHLLAGGVREQANVEEMRVRLNDYLKAVFATMLLEQLFTPPVARKAKSDTPSEGPVRPKLTLVELLGDIAAPNELIVEIFNKLMDYQQRYGTKDATELKAAFEKMTKDVLDRYDLGHVAAEVASMIWTACTKRAKTMCSAKMFDINLLSDSPLDFVTAYTSGLYGIRDFRDLRARLRESFTSYEECKAHARSMGIKNKAEWVAYVKKLRQEAA